MFSLITIPGLSRKQVDEIKAFMVAELNYTLNPALEKVAMKASEALEEIKASRQQLKEIGGDVDALYQRIDKATQSAQDQDLPEEFVTELQGLRSDAKAINDRTPAPDAPVEEPTPIELAA